MLCSQSLAASLTTSLSQFSLILTKMMTWKKVCISTRVSNDSPINCNFTMSQQAKVNVGDREMERPNQTLHEKWKWSPMREKVKIHFLPLAPTVFKSRADWDRLNFSAGTWNHRGDKYHSSGSPTDTDKSCGLITGKWGPMEVGLSPCQTETLSQLVWDFQWDRLLLDKESCRVSHDLWKNVSLLPRVNRNLPLQKWAARELSPYLRRKGNW